MAALVLLRLNLHDLLDKCMNIVLRDVINAVVPVIGLWIDVLSWVYTPVVSKEYVMALL